MQQGSAFGVLRDKRFAAGCMVRAERSVGDQRRRVGQRSGVIDSSITLSPVYPAAASLLGSERGLSIRFPRYMKTRTDKGWEQATTADQFAEMYRKQIREAPARTTNGANIAVVRQGSEEADEEDQARDDEDDDV